MLTHVVCLKFAHPQDADEAARRLRAMEGQIADMKGIEVGLDITHSERSYHLVLITRHADLEGMQSYQVHPVHQAVLAWLKSKGPAAVAVDFTS